jgi:hypothetical protein
LWKCIVKRSVFAITVGGPIQVQVIELLDIPRTLQKGNIKSDDLEIVPQVADDMGEFDLQPLRRGNNCPFLME